MTQLTVILSVFFLVLSFLQYKNLKKSFLAYKDNFYKTIDNKHENELLKDFGGFIGFVFLSLFMSYLTLLLIYKN